MRLFEEYQSPKSPCGPGIHVPYRPSCMTSKKRSSIKMTKMDHCEVAHKTAWSVTY